jgi:hypothetical protein
MDSRAIKDVMYGSLLELIKNKQYFYTSAIKGYSHFTEDGEQAAKELLHMFAPMIQETEQRELDARAKDLVMKGLTS